MSERELYQVCLPINSVQADAAGMPAEWFARAVRAVGLPITMDTIETMNMTRDAALARVAELDAKNEELEEELSIWESVFPDLAPENVLPSRSLVEAEVARMREALEQIAEEHDAGRYDGLPEPCPAYNDVYVPWLIARAALQTKETKDNEA